MKLLRNPIDDERGTALPAALLTILVLTLVAVSIMVTVNVNKNIAGHNMRAQQALNIAEAGVAEALAHIRNGDVPSSATNPRMVGQVFLTDPGSVPTLGVDSIAMPTAQPDGKWLPYSKATKGPDVLTVQYKTNPARTTVYRYDLNTTPKIQTATGLPIFVINSTGRKGNDLSRVVTEVIQRPFNFNVKAALTANVDIQFVGNGTVCGYNHTGACSPPAGEDGHGGGGDICGPYATGSGDLYGSWTTGTTQNGGGAHQAGVPDPNISGQTGFYAGPWEALGMSQAEFYAWIGPPQASASNLDAIVHLDNNTTTQDQSADIAYHDATGEGFLYVDGDLRLNSSFVYRGLIYVEGDLVLNGQAWILGGMIVRGKAELRHNGGATMLYSAEAIQTALSKRGGQFVTLSWREQR